MNLWIPLTKGKFTVIDASDYPLVADRKWYAAQSRNTWYAVSSVRESGGKIRQIKMHRVIMDCYDAKVIVDHASLDGLDNRKFNLRLCTNAENCRNRRVNKNNSSGYRGVGYRKDSGKWVVRVTVNRKVIFIGSYDDKEDAIEAHKNAVKELHGDFTPDAMIASGLLK